MRNIIMENNENLRVKWLMKKKHTKETVYDNGFKSVKILR